MTLHQKTILGIDISKDHLDLHRWDSGRDWRIDNSAAAIAELIASLPSACHVSFEATSVFDRELQRQLAGTGMTHTRHNPRRAREFARAAGYLAKTDRVDARMVAHYQEAMDLAPSKLPDIQRRRLAGLIQRRQQLVEMRKQEKTRLRQADPECPDIGRDIEAMIAHLDRPIAALERQIRDLINGHRELARLDHCLRSMPGVGDIVSATLIAHMPELGTLDRRAVAALAGLAPLARDSGQTRGSRKVWGGRRIVRRALYLAAVTGRRNNRFGAFYDQLIDKRKPPKVAMIAVARKMITTLNAMIRDDQNFNQIVPLATA